MENKKEFQSIDEYIMTFPSAVQFPIDKPLPLPLITKIVKFRVLENIKKYQDKLKSKGAVNR